MALASLCLLAASRFPPRPLRAAAPSHAFLFSLQGEVENRALPTPPPEGEFEDACGVAVDPAGDIYVSDYYHHTIDVYGPGRGYLTQIADPDPDGPCNLAVDSAGDLYVNNWRRDVVRYAPSEFPPTEATTYGAGEVIDFPTGPVPARPASPSILSPAISSSTIAPTSPSTNPGPCRGRTPALTHLRPRRPRAGLRRRRLHFPATEGRRLRPRCAHRHGARLRPLGRARRRIDGAGTPQRGFMSLTDSAVAVDPTDGHLFVADDTEPGFESPSRGRRRVQPVR